MNGDWRPATIGAVDIARRLARPEPTAEQREVIEAGPGPALVVAGAGSGKTETMAARVVWLVANGYARPGEILGLTFTRKAAGELAERISTRLGALGRAGLLPTSGEGRDGHDGADHDGVEGIDPLDAPTVATYNSFANTLYREHALLIGREPDAAVLSEASAWQLAFGIVANSDDERLVEFDRSSAAITAQLLAFAHALSDNDIADHDAVARYAERFASVLELEGYRGAPRAPVADAVRRVSILPVLVELAQRFAAEKRRRGFVEFSDQVAFALEAVRRVPTISDDYRARYKFVLLDEYQDTSVVQTELLARLFRGGNVMAVGDPNQAIYGWRGASASNLAEFPRAFAAEGDAGGAIEVPRYPLTTSWRNPVRVLDAANAIAVPLNEASAADAGLAVERLAPRPGAGDGQLAVVWEEDVLAEARQVARWLQARLAARDAETGEPPTAAMLFRSVKRIGAFTAALSEAGVPYHVLGVGGLLEEPVVVDLVCALTVLVDPDAGSRLIRLLAGARWRIGPKDIKALRNLASGLARRDYRLQRLDDEVAERLRGSVADDEGASIVDALDFVATAPAEHRFLSAFSREGVQRMRTLGAQLARLRTRTGLELLDLVTVVVQELGLDIEVAANESAARGRQSLDAFLDIAAGFVSGDETATGLRGFLAWLEQAEQRDRLSPLSDPPEPGTVQILTVHASKGLEWDLVVLPRQVVDEFPSRYQGGDGWVSRGELPYEFRGDRLQLPVFAWQSAQTQKDVVDRLARFREELIERHFAEQRRLGYVAVTRARAQLLLGGSFWSTQIHPRTPGSYLLELQQAGLLPGVELPAGPAAEENPVAATLAEVVEWPHDPLGHRAQRVHGAAAAVRRAAADAASGSPLAPTEWDGDIDRLLAERAQRAAGRATAALPLRVPASRFKDFVLHRDATRAELVRPMPDKPYRQTRLGTLFHSWVEQRAGAAGAAETIDAGAFELDDADELFGMDSVAVTPADQAKLEQLKATFLASPWGDRQPVDVEVEVHLPLADRVVICKLDAVYPLPGGRYQVVDWKTGKAPRAGDVDDLAARSFQLSLYRVAYAKWKGVPVEAVDAVFYFVADDLIVEPDPLYSEAELQERWMSPSSSSGSPRVPNASVPNASVS